MGTGVLGKGAAPLQERLSLCCVQLLSRSVLVPLRPTRDAQPVLVLFLHHAVMFCSERRRAILMTRRKCRLSRLSRCSRYTKALCATYIDRKESNRKEVSGRRHAKRAHSDRKSCCCTALRDSAGLRIIATAATPVTGRSQKQPEQLPQTECFPRVSAPPEQWPAPRHRARGLCRRWQRRW